MAAESVIVYRSMSEQAIDQMLWNSDLTPMIFPIMCAVLIFFGAMVWTDRLGVGSWIVKKVFKKTGYPAMRPAAQVNLVIAVLLAIATFLFMTKGF